MNSLLDFFIIMVIFANDYFYISVFEKESMFFCGEENCQITVARTGLPCNKKAYYLQNDKLCCGTHSSFDLRKNLPERSIKDLIERSDYRTHLKSVIETRNENLREGITGKVTLSKMETGKFPRMIPGYFNVFPLYDEGDREDGFVCSGLSPMYMGPFETNQPGHLPVQNLENFRQGNKVFLHNIKQESSVYMLSLWHNRMKFYANKIPHSQNLQENNKLFYTLLYDLEGNSRTYGIVESRYFYCRMYSEYLLEDISEPLQRKDSSVAIISGKREISKEQFVTLQNLLSNGYNLNICGPDAYDILDTVDEAYRDVEYPYSQERILYTLLTTPPDKYPWENYRKEFPELYSNIVFK